MIEASMPAYYKPRASELEELERQAKSFDVNDVEERRKRAGKRD
jgi:hypothetical protein